MDAPEIEELKQLVRQSVVLGQENNKILRSMRTAGRLKSLVWWVLVLASLAASYYSYATFIEPRIEQIENFYNTTLAPLQGAGSSINELLQNFGKTASTTP